MKLTPPVGHTIRSALLSKPSYNYPIFRKIELKCPRFGDHSSSTEIDARRLQQLANLGRAALYVLRRFEIVKQKQYPIATRDTVRKWRHVTPVPQLSVLQTV